jgi:predicted  nucleic acid-binding Zn-ribbon protein
MTSRSKLAPRGRRFIFAAGLAVSLLAAGCDQDDATSRALDQSRIQLTAMSSGETLTTMSSRTNVYKSVLSQLGPVADRGTESQKAAAAILMAQARAGLAEGPMGAAAELETIALHQANDARALLSQWLMYSAAAAAAESYDPGPELKSIEDQTKRRQEVIAKAEADKGKVESQAAELRRQAQAKGEQARSLEQEASRLRQRIANQSAVEGEQSLLQAREITRRAHELEVEAAQLEARAEQLEPQIVETTTRVEGIREQLDRLAALAAEVQERAERSRSTAREARERASKVAGDLNQAVESLAALRSGDLAERYDEAVKGYQSAADSARRATGENRAAANLAIGSAQQAKGDVLWMRAHGTAFFHETLESVLAAQPALPESAKYRQLLQEAGEARQSSLDGATEAYKAAFEAFNAAGAGDRMERVGRALSEIVNTTSGGSVDLRAASGRGFDFSGDDEATGQIQTPGEVEWAGEYEGGSTPQETVAQLVAGAQMGDPGIVDLFYTETPQQRRILEALMQIMPVAKRLGDAMTEQFGAGADDGLKAMGGGMLDFDEFDPSELDFDIDGDRAEAEGPTGEPLVLREVEGRWLVDITEQLSGPEMQMEVAMLPQMKAALDQLADEVEQGRYNSPEEVIQALMMKMMGGGGGQRGGGGG